MDAIVYTSNTGSTKRYAELLSQMTGLPAFALGDAKDKLSGQRRDNIPRLDNGKQRQGLFGRRKAL